jgi:hypothetical protein
MGRTKRIPMRNVEKLEESLLEAMISDISGSNDPVDQFKAIERYQKFVAARAIRINSEIGFIDPDAPNYGKD